LKKKNEHQIENQPLSTLDIKRISTLKQAEIQFIDDTILSCISSTYKKQALVVISTRQKVEHKLPSIPLTYFSLRIQKMVEKGLIISLGNLNYLRYSELRKTNY